MENAKIKEARHLITANPSLIGANAPAVQAAESILRDPKTRAVYVVDREYKLLGTVNLRRLVNHFLPHLFEADIIGRGIIEEIGAKKVKDLIREPPVYVTEEDNLEKAVKLMTDNELEELPVVDKDLKVVGKINLLEILSIWLIKIQG